MSDTSVIHDIGYQRYDGPRLGRRHVFGALYIHGLRAAFGFGRLLLPGALTVFGRPGRRRGDCQQQRDCACDEGFRWQDYRILLGQ